MRCMPADYLHTPPAMLLAASSPDIALPFACAGLVLYIASRAAVDAVTVASDPSPGRMALAQWMPIAWTGILAALAGRPELGIRVAFASSVVVVSLNLGLLILLSPPQQGNPGATRAWPFILPAALLALLAGFSG